MQFVILRVVLVTFTLLTLAASTTSAGVLFQFTLSDHLDAYQAPPPYGLRFDDLFSEQGFVNAAGGVTTFSADDLTLTVTDAGGDIEMHIEGVVYGGEDAGSDYGFGEGEYMLDFTYTANVMAEGGGWIVSPPSALNQGTLTALGNYDDVTQGTVFNLFEKVENGMPAEFKPDGHRIDGDENTWVFRDWLSSDPEGGDIGAVRDFLFVGEIVDPAPEPGTLVLCAAGALTLGAWRPRR